MKFRRILSVVLMGGLVLLFTNGLFAQEGRGKGQEKREQVQERKNKADQVRELKAKPDKEQPKQLEKGNAGKAKGNKERLVKGTATDKVKDEVKVKDEDKDKAEVEVEDEDKDKASKSKGNAYGKNKGELEGRDFGQARAAEARQRNEAKRKQASRAIVDGEAELARGREKVRLAKERLEKDKQARGLDKAEILRREAAIQRAEKEIGELEESLEKGREKAKAGGN